MISKTCRYCNTEHPDTSEYWRYLPRGRLCRTYHREYNNQRRIKIRDEKRKAGLVRVPMGKELQAKRKLEKRKERLKTDVQYKTVYQLRRRLTKALKSQSTSKSSKFKELLGCTNEELKVYLTNKFQPGMTWENRKEWHIDHIIPLSRVDLSNPIELQKVAHYTNLQPLWAKDNLKKSNRWWYT